MKKLLECSLATFLFFLILPSFSISCTVGSFQYRPHPESQCDTQKKQCCKKGSSADWGEWDKDCPREACRPPCPSGMIKNPDVSYTDEGECCIDICGIKEYALGSYKCECAKKDSQKFIGFLTEDCNPSDSRCIYMAKVNMADEFCSSGCYDGIRAIDSYSLPSCCNSKGGEYVGDSCYSTKYEWVYKNKSNGGNTIFLFTQCGDRCSYMYQTYGKYSRCPFSVYTISEAELSYYYSGNQCSSSYAGSFCNVCAAVRRPDTDWSCTNRDSHDMGIFAFKCEQKGTPTKIF